MIDWDKLREPFQAEDIEWRVQQSGVKNGKGWAMVLAYVTNRAIQQRLDDVVGPTNWKNEYSKGPDDGVLCGISIRIASEMAKGNEYGDIGLIGEWSQSTTEPKTLRPNHQPRLGSHRSEVSLATLRRYGRRSHEHHIRLLPLPRA